MHAPGGSAGRPASTAGCQTAVPAEGEVEKVPSPFPGMDPYLEDPTLWPHVHTGLVVALHDELGPRLRPKYYVAIQRRVYKTTYDDPYFVYPDVALGHAGESRETAAVYHAGRDAPVPGGAQVVFVPVPREMQEGYLEIRRTGTGEVVTVVEVLSPGNKRPGQARTAYEAKRERVLASGTSLVEVDLLRSYPPMPMAPEPRGVHYRILVSRAHERPKAFLYAFSVRQPVPQFPVPLDPGEPEPVICLGPLLAGLYDRASFDLTIDYSRPPVPPLDEDDARWAAEMVANWRRQISAEAVG